MKKLLAFVFVLTCVMSVLTSCSLQQDNIGSKEEQSNIETNEEKSEDEVADEYFEENRTDVPSTTQTSMRDWGFSNPELWGCKLLEIIGAEDKHFFLDEGGGFVIIEHTRFWEFYPNHGQITTYFYDNGVLEGDNVANYSVLDNDLISVYSSDEGNGMIRITERNMEDGKLIFGLRRGGDYETDDEYISYSLIDTTREPEFFTKGYYKLYLK